MKKSTAFASDKMPTRGGYLARTLTIATENARHEGGPFGALVVTADGRVFEGVNRVAATVDPSAHAEVIAIREACRGLEIVNLRGAVLYSSCEPCPMCLATALWARIEKIYYAADRQDAASAGFDDAVFYRYFEDTPRDRSIMPVQRERIGRAEALEPFVAWSRNSARINY